MSTDVMHMPARGEHGVANTIEVELRRPGPELTIGRELGRGRASRVYEASLGPRGLAVALKVFDPPARRRRSEETTVDRKLAALSRMRHPNIVPVHAVGRLSDGRAFVAMDCITDPTLEECMAREAGHPRPGGSAEPVPWNRDRGRQAIRVILRIAQALAYMHTFGYVHGKLTLASMVLRPDGSPLLVDTGHPGAIGSCEGLTPAQARTLSPEQLRRRPPRFEVRMDVYALGALLAQTVTAGPLVEGSDLDGVVARVRRGHRSSRRCEGEAGAELADLRRVIDRASAKKRRRRHGDAASVAADLQRILNGEPVRGPRRSWLRRLGGRARG